MAGSVQTIEGNVDESCWSQRAGKAGGVKVKVGVMPMTTSLSVIRVNLLISA